MLKRLLLCLMSGLLYISAVQAADILVKAGNITAKSQTKITTASLPISINSDVDVANLQFDLYLPSGFKFNSAEKGEVANSSHTVSASTKDGYTRIVLYSAQNQTFKSQNGKVLDITLDVDTALVSKDYDVMLKNIYVSDAAQPANRFNVSDQHAKIGVTTLAERIIISEKMVELGIGATRQLYASVYPSYTTDKGIKWSSDNKDVVSVSDGLLTGKATGLTDIRVTTDDGSNITDICHVYSDCGMISIDNRNTHSQSTVQTMTLPVMYNANADNSSMQMDLYLPSGFKFNSAEKGEVANSSHTVSASTKDGYTRIVLYSAQNQTFKSQNGKVLDITLDVDTALVSKDYDVMLKNIYVSDAAQPANRFNVSDQHAKIGVTTLAERIVFNEPFTIIRMNEKASIDPVILPSYTTDKRVDITTTESTILDINGNVAEAKKQGVAMLTVKTLDGSNLTARHKVYSECAMLYSDNRVVYSQSYERDITIPIILNSSNEISHIQFDLYLPTGFSLLSTEKAGIATEKHIVQYEQKSDFTRILCYAPDNSAFNEKNGEVLCLNIRVEPRLATGIHNVWLKNINLSSVSEITDRYEMPDWNVSFEVTTLIETMALEKKHIELFDGQSELLSVALNPDFAVNKKLNWVSLDNSLATVDSNGLISVTGDGKTKIIVTTTDGSNLSDTCDVVVKPVLAESLEMNPAELILEDQCTAQLSCLITPSNTTYKGLTWTSDDESTAMVDAIGFVVAKKVGTTTIRATTTDGTMLCATCEITVVPLPVKELTFSSDTIDLGIDSEVSLSVRITPENATDRTLSWKSTDENVATVDNYGVVRTLKEGTTDIVATSISNPSISGICTLVVHGIETFLEISRQSEDILRLEWNPMYNKYDIEHYNVYISENNGPFILWIADTTAKTALFKTKEDYEYSFLVTARDKAGNVERYNENNCVTINRE